MQPREKNKLSQYDSKTLGILLYDLGKKPPANAGDIRKVGSVPGSNRVPGVGNGNPFQDSCLESPMDRRPQWATRSSPWDHEESDATEVILHIN